MTFGRKIMKAFLIPWINSTSSMRLPITLNWSCGSFIELMFKPKAHDPMMSVVNLASKSCQSHYLITSLSFVLSKKYHLRKKIGKKNSKTLILILSPWCCWMYPSKLVAQASTRGNIPFIFPEVKVGDSLWRSCRQFSPSMLNRFLACNGSIVSSTWVDNW